MQDSGSVRYYAQRMTARFDSLPAGSLDAAMEMLRARGFRPYFLLEEWEIPDFRARFADASAAGRLDWRPMVSWHAIVPVALYDPSARPGTHDPSSRRP